MNSKITRRTGLKLATAGTIIGLTSDAASAMAQSDSSDVTCPWSNTFDRVWVGGEYWANPMEDWRVVNGAVECKKQLPDRNIHCLTRQIVEPDKGFSMSVEITPLSNRASEMNAGFRVGIRSDINEHRSNCFVPRGITAGIIKGMLTLGPKSTPINFEAGQTEILLKLTGQPSDNVIALTLEVMTSGDDQPLASVTHQFAREALVGNVAIVSNYPAGNQKGSNKSLIGHRFSNWKIAGDAFSNRPENQFGPILWSMYTLSDSRTDEGFILKLSALTGPMGADDEQTVELWTRREGDWISMGNTTLDPDAWVATFRIPQWDATQKADYKLVYREKHRDGTQTPCQWTGVIRSNPKGRPLRMAAMTCQNDYAFPYEPVAENLAKIDADIMYFSGDQIYENHGGYGIIREPAEPAILNYLRKFYQFGWAFRDVIKDCPTLCLPDDHDVFQGNIWGEGGAKMVDGDEGASSKGGYREPARMVNVVHKTNLAHHPDPFDPKPVKQDISVYYGDLVYGDVSFAIIADRQWKSGPERVQTDGNRADHVLSPDFDCSLLDKPGLILLGERQEAFLEQWADDWRGHTLKVLLSQTVFAGLATHHGSFDGYLKADLDSGGWPQTPRDRAISIIRKSKALHINGDQHLTSLCQYGVDKQRDSNWSFCTPAIAVGYPRWWRPDEMQMAHQNRPKHGLPQTGEYLDGLGNKVFVYAVGNPEVATLQNRYEKAHQKGSGFGFITMDPVAKSYHIESFRFSIDATDGNPSSQFPGWPVTIYQDENQGDNLLQ